MAYRYLPIDFASLISICRAFRDLLRHVMRVGLPPSPSSKSLLLLRRRDPVKRTFRSWVLTGSSYRFMPPVCACGNDPTILPSMVPSMLVSMVLDVSSMPRQVVNDPFVHQMVIGRLTTCLMNLASTMVYTYRTHILFSSPSLFRPLPLATPFHLSLPSFTFAHPLHFIRTVGYRWARTIPDNHLVLLPRRSRYHRGL